MLSLSCAYFGVVFSVSPNAFGVVFYVAEIMLSGPLDVMLNLSMGI